MKKLISGLYFGVAIAAVLLFLANVTSNAQTITASVVGTVTDASGAAIPGAIVTATNVATNESSKTATNNAGEFNIRFLQVGQYTLLIQAPAFATRSFAAFALEADQEAKFDAIMSVKGSQEQVTVTDMAPLINTEDASIGSTLDSTAVNSLPLNGRNFISLAVFTPGAVSTNPGALTGDVAITGMVVRGTANGSPSINGNRQQQNNYLLDGVEINETIRDTTGYNPSPDALDQVRIIASNAPAEFGNVNGGDIIALLKSGGNALHGSAFEYLEDHLMDANTWANKHAAVIIPRSSYTQSIFGGTVGGPIIKNKLFFFTDFSGGTYHLGGPAQSTVASVKMRSGDFSELLNPAIMCGTTGGVCASNKSLIQLYNPLNGFAPYANNQIPITSSVAKYLFANSSIYPLPNTTPLVGTPTTNNYTGPSKSAAVNDQGDIKIDWKATDKDQFSVSYSNSAASTNVVNPLAITFPLEPYSHIQLATINWDRIITQSIVNEFRAGFIRIQSIGGFPNDATGKFGLTGNATLGIPGVQVAPGFIQQIITSYTNPGNAGTGTNFTDNSFTYGDDLTWQRGKHAMKMGVLLLRYQQNSFYPGNDGVVGNMTYTGNFTSNPGANSTTNPNGYNTSGYALADFTADRIFSLGGGGLTGDTGQRQWRDAYFFQDDFRVTPKLTLNLGVRYEYDQPIYEVNNKEVDVNLQTGKLEFAGVNGASRALYPPTYTDVMPRVGFAYSVSNRLVVRGGYGITTFMEGTGENLRPIINPPFETYYSATGSAPSATSAGTYFVAENGFSNPASTATSLTYRSWGTPKFPPEFIGERSLTVEYQLSNTASLAASYVGESGSHLATANLANQLAAPCVIGGVVQATPNSAACTAADPAPFQALVGQSGLIEMTSGESMMNYNALQTTFRQRVMHGLMSTFNYTWARGMTTQGGFFGVPGVSLGGGYAENYYNLHAEYGPIGQDARQSLNGTLSYELPFGRGRLIGANMNRALDEAVGGWTVVMTGMAYTGLPLAINNSSNNAYTNNSVQRANHIRSFKIANRGLNNWFGTDPSAVSCGLVDNGVCAYGSPANGTYGTAAIGSERSPGFQQSDLSLAKEFTTFHEQKFGFRLDASNVFNMTAWSNPNVTAQSATFGQITSVRSVPRQLQISAKYMF